ncbi:tektin-1 isoform X2 [Agrilus planipennis]|uniref:Tektin n=1 Tax=Agrilus planipennis TaxID=224129 RepID=A0A7F5RCU4_AGRPL|nr:tektin-1 isoform X2 [Agrilus planipennis]
MSLSKITDKALVVLPPAPGRFTLIEWYLNNRERCRTVLDQQQLSDKILAESDRLSEQVTELCGLQKKDVESKLKEKILDIEFIKKEIEVQRREVCIEVDNLETYLERINDAMNSLREKCLKICRKCVILREHRLGIELCHDDVERELLKEVDVITGAQKLLQRVAEEASEQVRRLRSTIYFMDRDLENKENVLKIDQRNLILAETDLSLSMYHGFTPLDPANITYEEWEEFTVRNIENAGKELTSARQMRSYVDTLLKQVIEDLWNQYNIVNDSFRRRIEETKEAKTKMEIQHSEVVRQANEMTRNIHRLQKDLAEKEGFMALAHTRLGNRAQRPGMELCRDMAGVFLESSIRDLREFMVGVQSQLAEAQACLRYLLKTQIQLEEDINIKTNTLKIDEVECMTMRQGMDYHSF